MIVLAVANAVVLAAVVILVIAPRRRANRQEPTIDIVGRFDDDDAPVRVAEVITVEIRNHREVAASRTSLARPLASVAPRLVRSLVHQEACAILRRELTDQGVDADVRLRRLRLPQENPASDPGDPEAPAH